SPARLDWEVLLPEGWSFVSSSGNEGGIKPTTGATSLLEWSWTPAPASPIAFNYTLNVPNGASGDVYIIAIAQASGPVSVMAQPDPLAIHQIQSRHSGDTNSDFRISLLELTRIIELYNTRNSTTRTGC